MYKKSKRQIVCRGWGVYGPALWRYSTVSWIHAAPEVAVKFFDS